MNKYIYKQIDDYYKEMKVYYYKMSKLTKIQKIAYKFV